MDHNANILHDSADFVAPMLEFFALPSRGLEEMQVPSWAFDKRLSPFYLQGPVKAPKQSLVPVSQIFGTCTACTACGKCTVGPAGPQGSERGPDGDLVEETITGAIETVLGRKEEAAWKEVDACAEPTATSDPVSPSKVDVELHQSLPAASEIVAGKNSRPWGSLPMGDSFINVGAQELPMPPSDDAVPVIPHATVRRHAGRVPMPTVQMRNAARPMMSWRPHVPAKLLSQSPPTHVSPDSSPENLFESIEGFTDLDHIDVDHINHIDHIAHIGDQEFAEGTTLIRI
jgi:hypothetical protein